MNINYTLSLIVTSRNRTSELQRFIKTLNVQRGIDLLSLQLIFVDQEDNKELFNSLDKRVELKYIKYHKCSLSEARNQALPFVNREYVCFGDDDSWYDCDTFQNVFQWLRKGYDGVFGVVMNENGYYCNVFPSDAQRLTYTHHCGAMSASMFLKFDAKLKFDENIGVGSPFNLGSGEETDYLLSYMETHPKFNFYYTPMIVVRHPVNKIEVAESYFNKHYSYARGAGYVLRKHKRLPLSYKILQLVRPACGMILFGLTNRVRARKSYYLFKGRIEGYFYKIETAP